MKTNTRILTLMVILLFFYMLSLITDNPFNKSGLNKFKSELVKSRLEQQQIKHRRELAILMETIGGRKMVEIGVHRGDFALELLERWPSIEKYYGIDPWQSQKNYMSQLNMDNQTHQIHYEKAVENLKKFGRKVELIRGFSTEVVHQFEDNSLDLVFVDGRHDYCGCLEDLEAYWPKLKSGGIMAGHDYMKPIVQLNAGVDWTLCKDGSKHEGGIIAAVNDFMKKHKIDKLYEIHEKGSNPSFYFLKPYQPF